MLKIKLKATDTRNCIFVITKSTKWQMDITCLKQTSYHNIYAMWTKAWHKNCSQRKREIFWLYNKNTIVNFKYCKRWKFKKKMKQNSPQIVFMPFCPAGFISINCQIPCRFPACFWVPGEMWLTKISFKSGSCSYKRGIITIWGEILGDDLKLVNVKLNAIFI